MCEPAVVRGLPALRERTAARAFREAPGPPDWEVALGRFCLRQFESAADRSAQLPGVDPDVPGVSKLSVKQSVVKRPFLFPLFLWLRAASRWS
jgi:hypothetical protein